VFKARTVFDFANILATNIKHSWRIEMNKTNLLVTGAVVAFVAATGAAMAQ
jgi:hypothetical protein